MKLVNGFWWPDHDYHCNQVLPDQVADIAQVLPLVTDFSCCIQAGGNVGVWPKELAKHFTEVHTFEPDRQNFECLEMNVKEANVFKYRKALSNTYEMVTVKAPKGEERNCGAYQIVPGNDETVVLDDLCLDPGLIYLDIEGYELFALKGAEDTIKRCKPVIAFESKRLSDNYGVVLGDVEKYLSGFGYTVAKKIHRDVVCTAG